jgi:nitroreductase
MSKKDIIIINGNEHIAFEQTAHYDDQQILEQSKSYFEWLKKRRSIRMFSNRPVPKTVIGNLIRTAATAPSGAHKQPWTFCAVSNQELKREIRIAAEIEEKVSYESRMSDSWKKDLEPLATNMHKPFLEEAPWLIIAFKKIYDLDEKGHKQKNYYVNESVGIACGLLISAIHNAGLVTLTHTPSPMNFLSKILDRPANERAYILFPVGFPADKVYVPKIERKTLPEISNFFE